eukprot:521968-Karenia_brevis.AAC.1
MFAPTIGWREGGERFSWWSEGVNVRTGGRKGPVDFGGRVHTCQRVKARGQRAYGGEGSLHVYI